MKHLFNELHKLYSIYNSMELTYKIMLQHLCKL